MYFAYKQEGRWLNSKVWDSQNQTFGDGYHMIAKYLSKVLIIAKQARLRYKMFVWYNTSNYAYLEMTLLCKVLLWYQIGRDKRHRKSLVNIPAHPPLYCNEEEIEGFDLKKEEVQTL